MGSVDGSSHVPPVAVEAPAERGRASRRGWSRFLSWSTPVWIRVIAAIVGVAVLALGALLQAEVNRAQTSLTVIGQQTAPEVKANSDLYFALTDMDAQVANALLVGDRTTNLGFARSQALAVYAGRQEQADKDIRLASVSVTDAATARTVDGILDTFGQYQALAAQTLLLDRQTAHDIGRPGAAALVEYRKATDLSRTQLLPRVKSLADGQAARLDATYQSAHDELTTARVWVVVLGAVLLVMLVGLQVYLARRFHRVTSPPLLVATVAATVGLVLSVGLLTTEADQLKVAKKDAFDSLIALESGRAITYDANADESRFLVDPARALQYQQEFVTKSQEFLDLPGASITTWDSQLKAAIAAYQARETDVRWGGLMGTEIGNITFPGERAAANDALLSYQAYQLDDRRIRALNAAGNLGDAIALAIGDSNVKFATFDTAFGRVIGINQSAFDQAIADGDNALRGWTIGLWVGCAALLLLSWLGTRRRLSEYRAPSAR